ncbi:MAG: T9SS type A sorting domain-containing protein, partial [Flavobacteriales bacterium]|nr:T9SS type A sorting domain-containing protein [Flavobacteriales bacterium]
EYFVMVHGYDQSQGAFTLTMTCTAPCAPVENDNCTNPTPLTLQLTGGCETSTGTNECAFATGVPNPPCDPWGNIVDTWYSFNSSWATNLTLSLEAVDAEFVNTAIYTACDAPEYIECWTAVDAPIALNVPANTELLLRIWNGGGVDAGTYNVCVEGDFNVGVSASTGSAGQLIQLYPVPVRDVLTAQPLDGIATLTVVDLQGRTLMSTSTNGLRSAQLDVNVLAPGSYLLLGDGSMVGRFVKE